MEFKPKKALVKWKKKQLASILKYYNFYLPHSKYKKLKLLSQCRPVMYSQAQQYAGFGTEGATAAANAGRTKRSRWDTDDSSKGASDLTKMTPLQMKITLLSQTKSEPKSETIDRESLPSSFQNYIDLSYAKCINQQERDYIKMSLIQIIHQHTLNETLITKDWMQVDTPLLPRESTKIFIFP